MWSPISKDYEIYTYDFVLGQFVPASERCDDPLLAVLESPSTVHLVLNQMFLNIKPSTNTATSPVKTLDEAVEPTKPENVSHEGAKEEDDGGGRYKKICMIATCLHKK